MGKRERVLKKRRKPVIRSSDKKEKQEMERGQVWSVDVMLAVVIFVSVIVIFYTTMTPRQQPQMKDLEAESQNLMIELENNNDLAFISDNAINQTMLDIFIANATTNYTYIKQKLGIKGDFCIYYTDTEGNIVPIGSSSLVGIGSPNITVAGIPCGSPLS